MIKRILTAGLTALALSAQAAPISFFDVVFDVTAVAITDGGAGFESQTSPPSATPVSASAGSIGATDVATAGALGAPGLLTASTDVSASGIASAVATARFAGSFLNDGPVILSLGLTQADFAVGSGSAASSLFVSLVSDGVTLFEDFVGADWTFDYLPTSGTTSRLDLTLTSESLAGFPTAGTGGASSFALVDIGGTVPVPATWLLAVAGLALVVRSLRAVPRRAAVAA